MGHLQDPCYEVIVKGAPERVLDLCTANEQIFSNLRSWDATFRFHQSRWSCMLLRLLCLMCAEAASWTGMGYCLLVNFASAV